MQADLRTCKAESPQATELYLTATAPTSQTAREQASAIFSDVRDVLASMDCLVTKPGYGAFTEAACNGVAVLYVERGDWPEEPYLCPWLEANTRALRISQNTRRGGALRASLEAVWSLPAPSNPPAPTGTAEAAKLLMPYLD